MPFVERDERTLTSSFDIKSLKIYNFPILKINDRDIKPTIEFSPNHTKRMVMVE